MEWVCKSSLTGLCRKQKMLLLAFMGLYGQHCLPLVPDTDSGQQYLWRNSCGHQSDPAQPLRTQSCLNWAKVSSCLQMPPHSPSIPLHTLYQLCSLLLQKFLKYFFLTSSTSRECRQNHMLHSKRCKNFCSLIT